MRCPNQAWLRQSNFRHTLEDCGGKSSLLPTIKVIKMIRTINNGKDEPKIWSKEIVDSDHVSQRLVSILIKLMVLSVNEIDSICIWITAGKTDYLSHKAFEVGKLAQGDGHLLHTIDNRPAGNGIDQ